MERGLKEIVASDKLTKKKRYWEVEMNSNARIWILTA